MGDEFDFEDFPGAPPEQPFAGPAVAAPPPQQRQPAPPVLPADWTNANELDLQKVNQGLAQVESDIWNGTLDEETGRELMAHVQGRRQELLLRKQQAQAAALGQQQQALLHANAQRQAMLQADAAHDAANFQNRTASKVNPLTGQVADFFMTEPGKWQQIDWPEGAAAEGEGHGYAPPAPQQDERSALMGSIVSQGVSPEDAEWWVRGVGRAPTPAEIASGAVAAYAKRAASPEAAAARAQWEAAGTTGPDAFDIMNGAPYQMEVGNGPRREVVSYTGGQITGRQQFDERGQLQQPQGDVIREAMAAGVLNDHLLQVFRKQAMQIAGPAPPMMVPGRFGPVQNRAYAAWQARVGSAADHLAAQYAKAELSKQGAQRRSDEAQRHEKAVAGERQRQEQARADEHRRQEQARAKAAEDKDHSDRWQTAFRHHTDELQKEFDKHYRDTPVDQRPPEFQGRDAMEAEAERRADREYQRAYGRLPAARRDKAAAPSAGAKPAQRTVEAMQALAALRQQQAAVAAAPVQAAQQEKLDAQRAIIRSNEEQVRQGQAMPERYK